MNPLESAGNIRPPTQIWSPRELRGLTRDVTATSAPKPFETTPLSFEARLTNDFVAHDAEIEELEGAARETARVGHSARKMSGALEELRALAARSGETSVKDIWSRAEVQARVHELMRYMRDLAADSRSDQPRVSIETARGTIEFPPRDLRSVAREVEGDLALDSIGSARTSVAASERALHAIRSMRAQLSQFARKQLAPARHAAEVARSNIEAATSTLPWDPSTFQDAAEAQDSAEQVVKGLIDQSSDASASHRPLDAVRVSALLVA